jgi:small subunit ribosomal protein S2
MKELLETGVHFGHRTRKWNPKMGRYIFTERKGIHIIDLEQTVEMFKKAYYTIRDSIAGGGSILFVGTKKQVQATIVEEAQRCGAHYINRRWLGGTLTNFATIRQSIERMKRLEGQIEDGTVDHMPNKEASKLRRELAKLQRNLDGLRSMERKPDLLYIIDPDVETNAVHEANLVGIPIIAIVDTNCDPDPIDLLIPGNDDAIKATKLITARIADAVLEGREGRQDEPAARPAAQALAEDDAAEGAETESEAAEEEKPTVEEASEPATEDGAAPTAEAADEPTTKAAESVEAEAETSEDEEEAENESTDEADDVGEEAAETEEEPAGDEAETEAGGSTEAADAEEATDAEEEPAGDVEESEETEEDTDDDDKD